MITEVYLNLSLSSSTKDNSLHLIEGNKKELSKVNKLALIIQIHLNTVLAICRSTIFVYFRLLLVSKINTNETNQFPTF